LDADAAAAWYADPAFVVKNDGIVRFDQTGKAEYFAALMGANASHGEHAWQIAAFNADLPTDNGAVVTVRWVCARPDGSIIWDFADTYIVARTDDGWRILGDIVHDRG
jgi:ketosteroid isomerase-like protein